MDDSGVLWGFGFKETVNEDFFLWRRISFKKDTIKPDNEHDTPSLSNSEFVFLIVKISVFMGLRGVSATEVWAVITIYRSRWEFK